MHMLNAFLVMRDSYLVYDGNPMDLFTSKNIDAWNLDIPDVLQVANALQNKYSLTFKTPPKRRRKFN